MSASAWFHRDIETRRWEDTGVNVQRGKWNFTAHVGRNKLDRYVGWQAGIQWRGGVTREYMLLSVWVYHWTANIGLTWKPPRVTG